MSDMKLSDQLRAIAAETVPNDVAAVLWRATDALDLLDAAERALERVTCHTDDDGLGTVLIVDILHARATLAKIRGV